MRAWKPLHIPSTRPSLSFISLLISSVIAAFLKAVAKNLAEPSGSSPALKPPGNMIICAFLISSANSCAESRISSAERFLNTLVTTSAPARSNALVLSYSQLVPGNTGMNTVGLATLCLHTYTLSVLYTGVSSSLPPFTATVGNTFSSVAFHEARASSTSIFTSAYSNAALSVTSPITVPSATPFLSAATSATIHPYIGAKSLSALTAEASSLTPSLLPNAILLTAAAIPLASSVYADTITPSAISLLISEYNFLTAS